MIIPSAHRSHFFASSSSLGDDGNDGDEGDGRGADIGGDVVDSDGVGLGTFLGKDIVVLAEVCGSRILSKCCVNVAGI